MLLSSHKKMVFSSTWSISGVPPRFFIEPNFRPTHTDTALIICSLIGSNSFKVNSETGVSLQHILNILNTKIEIFIRISTEKESPVSQGMFYMSEGEKNWTRTKNTAVDTEVHQK